MEAKRPRGRPTKLTPELQDAICKLVRRGVPKHRAARLSGISEHSFHGWLARGREEEDGIYRRFFEAVSEAENDLLRKAVDSVVDLFDPSAPGADRIEPSTRLNAAKFILSHRYREDFTTRTETEVSGKDGGPVRVDATVRPLLSDDQLAQLTPEQLAAAVRGLVEKSGL